MSHLLACTRAWHPHPPTCGRVFMIRVLCCGGAPPLRLLTSLLLPRLLCPHTSHTSEPRTASANRPCGTVSDSAEMISAEIKELGNNHMALVQELMHPAAFGASSPLGERAPTRRRCRPLGASFWLTLAVRAPIIWRAMAVSYVARGLWLHSARGTRIPLPERTVHTHYCCRCGRQATDGQAIWDRRHRQRRALLVRCHPDCAQQDGAGCGGL